MELNWSIEWKYSKYFKTELKYSIRVNVTRLLIYTHLTPGGRLNMWNVNKVGETDLPAQICDGFLMVTLVSSFSDVTSDSVPLVMSNTWPSLFICHAASVFKSSCMVHLRKSWLWLHTGLGGMLKWTIPAKNKSWVSIETMELVTSRRFDVFLSVSEFTFGGLESLLCCDWVVLVVLRP